MIVSIFKDLTFVTGLNCSYIPPQDEISEIRDEEGNIIQEFVPAIPESGNPDCVACIDVDFDNTNETIEIVEKEGKYTANIFSLPIPPETPDKKHSRIYGSIVSSVDLSSVDLEGESFSDFDIGEMITDRVFGGNIHAQSALQAKIIAMMLSGNLDTELLKKAKEIETNINAVRNLFNLGNL